MSICPYGPYNIYDPSIYPPTHLTLPPSIQFVYLYVRMGLIIYWGETTQGETTQGQNDPPNKGETTHPKNKGETTQGETTHGRNDPDSFMQIVSEETICMKC